MEPVKGGFLAAVPEAAEEKLKSLKPEFSPAAWALHFAASQEGVLTVLSGMSTLAQVQDNVGSMKDFEPLTKEEQEICKLYGRRHEDGRTRCSECPMVMDSRFCICKGNCTEEEYEEWKEGRWFR